MEAILKNVPPQVNDRVLRKHLEPYMARLSIDIYSISKAPGKTFATLTFLAKDHCLRFLKQHGQVVNKKTKRMENTATTVQINLLGNPVYCDLNNREPDPYQLRSLELELKQRSTKSSGIGLRSKIAEPEQVFNVFDTASFSCGVWDYIGPGSDLVFVAHEIWREPGCMRFGPRSLILKQASGDRMEIAYSAIMQITAVNEPHPSMTFTLSQIPHFSQQDPLTAEKLFAQISLNNNARHTRIPDIRVTSFNSQHGKLMAGCLIYRISCMPIGFREKLVKLRVSHGFPSVVYRSTTIRSPTETWQAQWGRLRKALAETYHQIPFRILFQIQKLAQNGYLHPGKVLEILPHIAVIAQRSSSEITVATIKNFTRNIPYAGPEVDGTEFSHETLVDWLNHYEKKATEEEDWAMLKRASDNVAIIHRVTVTPGGILLSGPEPENKNRVLRKYPLHHEYFLRVQFADEDGEPVRFEARFDQNIVFHNRFKRVLEEGIIIAGRKYAFLGFSHSSLRAQTCWFMAPFLYKGELLWDRMVIQNLGDFKLIRSPAKCAARIGQAFSETPDVIPLGSTTIITVPDVERNGHVFSDGVGSFSPTVLKKVQSALPRKHLVKPLLYQIRHSGAKGMLSLDTRLQGDVMCLRPSMIKFPGTDAAEIELCGAAYRPLPMFLNRQLIKIMEDLQFDLNWFLKLQAEAVNELRSSTKNAKNAAKFLQSHLAGDVALIPKLIQRLGYCNWNFQEDEFLFHVLETAVMIELRALKHRTRIPVAKGATLYGIMDETNTLEEGQVFCSMDTERKTQKIVTGDRLVITRSPALHPGDVRLVKGVTLPVEHPLMQLRNCVVFSQKGERDLPSQLSGGDLDGDLYNIIWDEEASPRTLFTPADYPRAKAIDIGREVTRSDMTDFFVNFMATDQLGRIAILHQVLADQRTQGTVDTDCIKLAAMHSTAVDFSKTGIPVDIREMPKYSRFRPDFMAPGPNVVILKKAIIFDDVPSFGELDDDDARSFEYYESNKILGQLYRAIDERDVFKDIQQYSGKRAQSHVMQGAWAYIQSRCRGIQWMHLRDLARDIREIYECCIREIISQYSLNPGHPITEVEVVVGNIVGKTGAPSKRQRELATSMKEQYDRDVSFTINSIIKDGDKKSPEALERSLACFSIAFEESSLRSKGETLRSFLYVAAAVCFREVEPGPA